MELNAGNIKTAMAKEAQRVSNGTITIDEVYPWAPVGAPIFCWRSSGLVPDNSRIGKRIIAQIAKQEKAIKKLHFVCGVRTVTKVNMRVDEELVELKAWMPPTSSR